MKMRKRRRGQHDRTFLAVVMRRRLEQILGTEVGSLPINRNFGGVGDMLDELEARRLWLEPTLADDVAWWKSLK